MSTPQTPIGCAVVGLKQGLETVHVLLNHSAFDLKLVCDTGGETFDWITGRKSIEDSENEYAQFAHIRELVRQIGKDQGLDRIQHTRDFTEILERKDIQAVFLFTPDALHEEMTIAALRAGKYVLCTKPMALTLPSARAIAKEARERPGRYMLGLNFAYSPFATKVMQQIRSGALGTISQMSFHYHRTQFRAVYRQRSASRGSIMQEGCHWLDLLHQFNGGARFTKIAGFGGLDHFATSQDIEDNGTVIIEYENNMRAALLFTYFRKTTPAELLTINGDKGQLRGTFDKLVVETDSGEHVIEVGTNHKLPGTFHHGYYEMHEEFAAMIHEEREPYSGWECGLENMLISETAQHAVDIGGIVNR